MTDRKDKTDTFSTLSKDRVEKVPLLNKNGQKVQLYCSYCFEFIDICNHWHVEPVDILIDKPSLLGFRKETTQERGVKATCLSCHASLSFSLAARIEDKVCQCGRYLMRGLPAHTLSKYPQKHCPECKGAGKKEYDEFTPCPNCKGSGGVSCTAGCVCGLLLSPSIIYGQDGIQVGSSISGLKCVCDKGWSNRCQECRGGKMIISGRKEGPCNKCYVVK